MINIPDDYRVYLSGSLFSDQVRFPVQQKGVIRHRTDAVISSVAKKNILHIGCLDHVPLIDGKIRAGKWFHQQLTDVAESCLGIDIDSEGIDYVREEIGVSNILLANIMTGEGCEHFLSKDWDYAVFGEVLEHIPDPVAFLKSFKEVSEGKVERIIVTVPNAFRGGNFLSNFKNEETINSDHIYWFSPYTLLRVIEKSGWISETLELCQFSDSSGLKRFVKQFIINRWKMFAEDLVVTARSK